MSEFNTMFNGIPDISSFVSGMVKSEVMLLSDVHFGKTNNHWYSSDKLRNIIRKKCDLNLHVSGLVELG